MRGGKRVRMLKNPSYSGISTEFWNACAAIAGPRALDAVGRAQLRQGPARAGDGHRPRRQPGAFPQDQSGERVCRLTPRPFAHRWWTAARAQGVGEVEAILAHREPGADALRQQRHPPERRRAVPAHLSVRARIDGRTARASTNRLDARCHPQRGGTGHRPDASDRARCGICCRWPSRPNTGPWTAGSKRTAQRHSAGARAGAVAEAIRAVEAAGQTAAGIYSTDDTEYIADELARRRARYRETMARFSITAMAGDSSGWAKASACDHGDLNPLELALSAARKAAQSAAPQRTAAGPLHRDPGAGRGARSRAARCSAISAPPPSATAAASSTTASASRSSARTSPSTTTSGIRCSPARRSMAKVFRAGASPWWRMA